MPRKTLRTLARLFLGGMTALAAVLPSERASASFTVVPPPEVTEATASYKYANMSDVEAYAELDRRKVPYKKADPIAGVLAPVRLTGKLHGVWIHSSIPESLRATSVYEVLDARLALALDDFAKILERHDIEEVVHYSLYRPNVPREDHDVKEVARSLPALPAKQASSDAKATAPLAAPAKAPAAPTATAPAKVAVSNKAAPHAAAAAQKPGAPPIAKTNKALPNKAPALPAKPQGAKSAGGAAPPKGLPQLPAKALPQLPAKTNAPVHGAKQKAPVAIDKPSPAPAKAAPHPKTTANKAMGTPVRARASAPVKAPLPAAAPAKGAKSGASAKPAAPAISTATAKSAPATTPTAKTGVATTPTAAAKTGVTTTTAKTGVATTQTASRQTWAAPGTRHPAGLAIDVALLKKRDGQWISVTNDFHGKIGAKTCGDGVRPGDTPEARELRSLVCEANDLGVFTYVLTPNYNAAHYDHFHMEIRPATRWFLYH